MAKQYLIRFDWAMKRLLRSKANFGILEGFLSELLKRDLTILEVLDSESNQLDQDNKFNRVDILVKLADGEIVLIEVQTDTEEDYFSRMLFGTSKVITEHIYLGDKYVKVKKVYSVNILYFDLGHGNDYIYHGTTNFIGLHINDQLSLSVKQQEFYKKNAIHHIYPEYYLIKVNQFDDIAKDTLDEWIYFLKNETIKDGFKAKGLVEAKEKLDSMKMNKEERLIYDRYVEDIRYRNSILHSNYSMGKIEGKMEGKIEGIQIGKEEGIQIGKEEGMQIGKEEGIQIGKEEGIQIGKEEGRIRTQQIIKNLLATGMPVEQVATIVNVNPNEIDRLTLTDVDS
jgi:predicted transposase/invertase (TIGR01784 family)